MENEVKEPALKYNYTSAEEYLEWKGLLRKSMSYIMASLLQW